MDRQCGAGLGVDLLSHGPHFGQRLGLAEFTHCLPDHGVGDEPGTRQEAQHSRGVLEATDVADWVGDLYSNLDAGDGYAVTPDGKTPTRLMDTYSDGAARMVMLLDGDTSASPNDLVAAWRQHHGPQ